MKPETEPGKRLPLGTVVDGLQFREEMREIWGTAVGGIPCADMLASPLAVVRKKRGGERRGQDMEKERRGGEGTEGRRAEN